MIGHIYINGQIGTFGDQKGVELQDVVSSMESKKDSERVYVHINSGGGDLDVGDAIKKYLSSFDNVYTIAETLCGSAATPIHLSVPVERRKIVAGTEYFIHNPYLSNVTGNAEELSEMSEYILASEKSLLNTYVKTTTASKAALEGLMKNETSLTDDQALTLGFASEVIPKVELKPIAFISKKQKQELTNMDIKKIIKEAFASALAETKKEKTEPTVVAATVETSNGILEYASEGELPIAGEMVTVEGAQAPSGDYVVADGTVIKVGEDGNVSEIVEVEVEASVDELKAKIAELEANKTVDVEALKASIKAELEVETKAAIEEQVNEFKKTIASGYVPEGKKKVFGKTPAKKLSLKEEIAARKELRKQD